MSLFFAFRPFFSVEHVEFEMAGWSRERLMASVAYSRIDGQYFFIAQKRNSCVFSLLGNNIEYSFSGSSREGHELDEV